MRTSSSTNFDQDDSRAKVARKRKWRTFRAKQGKLLRLNAFDKQGAAFVLTLAIGIVGVSAAWYTGQRLQDNADAPLPQDSYQAQTVEEEDDSLQILEESTYDVFSPETPQEEQAEQTEDLPVSVAVTEESVLSAFVVPVQGTVVGEFSIDALRYNDTLGQWSTHCGVDYAADAGTPVCAALDGVVESVENDPLLGCTVTLSHDCGIKTVYAGLESADAKVAQGVRLSAGDTLGSVGTSAVFEAHLGAHLHFELLNADGYLDPSAAGNT